MAAEILTAKKPEGHLFLRIYCISIRPADNSAYVDFTLLKISNPADFLYGKRIGYDGKAALLTYDTDRGLLSDGTHLPSVCTS